MIEHYILGPYLFEENVTVARYLDFLHFDIVPALVVLYP